MPELPEVASRAKEIQKLLVGKTIKDIEVLQPKCLNVTPRKFKSALKGAKLLETTYHGKWIFTKTTNGHLLLNFGMGADVTMVPGDELPEKRQVVLFFDDGTALYDSRVIAEHFDAIGDGPALLPPSGETRRTVQCAESRPQALALLSMPPEFQRR